MLKQVFILYGVSWLAALAVAGALEWAQLVRRDVRAGGSGRVKALAIGWVALPFVAPAVLALAVARGRTKRGLA